VGAVVAHGRPFVIPFDCAVGSKNRRFGGFAAAMNILGVCDDDTVVAAANIDAANVHPAKAHGILRGDGFDAAGCEGSIDGAVGIEAADVAVYLVLSNDDDFAVVLDGHVVVVGARWHADGGFAADAEGR